MTPVLNEKRRWDKLIVAALLVFSLRLEAAEPGRNFFAGVWENSRDLALAPVEWRWRGWGSALAASAGLAVMANNDTALYHSLRGRQDWLDRTMPAARDMGDGLYSALLAGGLWGLGEALDFDELAASSATALGALAVTGIVTPILKPSFSANRPSTDDQHHGFFDYSGARYSPSSASFPSGHTMSAFAMAEAFGASYGRWWTYPLAACTAYARIYEAQHWPSDVVLGAILGASIGHLAVKARQARGPAWHLWGSPSPGGAKIAWAANF